MTAIKDFMKLHYRHFNARETVDAAQGWCELLDQGGQMLLAMAGAMSTAELGISLAQLIRADKVQAICCTAANLEEDAFNLFAHNEYRMVPNYRDLSPTEENELLQAGLNRVTDTCIPETIMRHTESILIEMWAEAAAQEQSAYPYEYMYRLLDREELTRHYQVPAEHSWLVAAKEKNIPIFVPGFEDSTLGNIFTARVMDGTIANHQAVRTGTETMALLASWYLERAEQKVPVGFFQIGGGIAGDFPICVVPMLIQDLRCQVPTWAYFAQIGDSTTSYGSYSGAVPNEKITWGKLSVGAPKYMINSDASLVAPLVFAYVMGW
jgi:deoxyhypusine synthase